MNYFRKELPQRTLFTPEGKRVAVEILDNSVGVIASKDKAESEWLNSIAGTQGVSKITKSNYVELKKKIRLDNVRLQLAQQRSGAEPQTAVRTSGGASSKITDRKKCGSCGGRRST